MQVIPDMVRATPRGRMLATVLVALTIALLAFFQLVVLPFINASLSVNPSLQTITTLKYGFACFAAVAILPAIMIIATGRKILVCGQCPLPNAWMWRDTKIKRGTDAVRIAWLCIVSGALACLLCTAFVMYIWIMIDRFVPEHNLRSGVTVLQQRSASK